MAKTKKKKDKPYKVDSAGNKAWYQNGELHRDDGPAIEYADGTKLWYNNGKIFEPLALKQMVKTKKKQTSAKKVSKILPPTPEEGWELVDKNDPRLKKLPCMPRVAMRRRGKWSWGDSSYNKGEEIHATVLRSVSQYYALPIEKIEKPAVKAPCSIRLRLPSEKPTANDCDWNTHIYIRNTKGDVWVKWVWYTPMPEGTICWIPGRITDAELADLPKPVTQEDIWRAEGEKIWPSISGELLANNENGSKEVFLRGYLAAKKGK